MSTPRKGTLAIVGTGIQAGRQLTHEAIAWLRTADRIMFCLSEPLTRDWLMKIRPDAEDLARFYADGKDRRVTYDEMVSAMLAPLSEGASVAAAFYGHPGVFVSPSHEAIRKARAAGFRAFMLPGISAEACLYADLGIDPAEHGCLSYEASEWLVFGHRLDPSCAVILWQVDCVGDPSYRDQRYEGQHVPLLVEALLRDYPADHVAYLYQAAVLPVGKPKLWPLRLGRLAEVLATHKTSGTLYIPPAADPPVDLAMARRLGIPEEEVGRESGMPPWRLDGRFQIIDVDALEPKRGAA